MATRLRSRSELLFWGAVFLAWGLLVAAFASVVVAEFGAADGVPLEGWALAGVGVASSVIWFGGIRHLAMWTLAVRSRRHLAPPPLRGRNARVALVYCTADDANLAALMHSMAQDHPVTTVILDDSVLSERRDAVDGFASRNGIEVVRRTNRVGFKAGNLNHALPRLLPRFDYVVVLDSDEMLPSHFVSRALTHFVDDPAVGVVQGAHRALPGSTGFSATFAGMLESHVAVARAARSRVGLSVFMGRGAMISTECLRAAGPLPELVTEDVAFTVEARIAGYDIRFDPDLVSVEDFPVDYHAFRTQYAKNVAGTTELLLSIWGRIARSRLRFAKKLDVAIEQLLLPATALAGLALLLSGLVLAASAGDAAPPVWAIAATALFGTSALLPETVRLFRTRSALVAGRFLCAASALYASMMLVTLQATLGVLLGRRARFVVTPKTAAVGSVRTVVSSLRFELAAGAAVAVVAVTLCGSLAPAMPVLAPAAAALCFASAGLLPYRRRLAESASRVSMSPRSTSAVE